MARSHVAEHAPKSSSGQSPYSLEVQEKRGTLTVLAPGGAAVLGSFWVELEMENGDVLTTCQSGLKAGAKGWSAELANGRIVVTLFFRRSFHPPGAVIWASVTNRSTAALGLRQVRLARASLGEGRSGRGDPAGWRILRAARPAYSGLREEGAGNENFLVRMDRELTPVRCPGAAAVHFPSGAPGLLAGFVTADRFMSWIELKRDRGEVELSAVCETEGAPVLPGTSVSTERLYLALHRDLFAGLAGYAEFCAKSGGVSSLKQVQAGWCPPLRETDGRRAQLPAAMPPELKVVRHGEGRREYIGDWLVPSPEFPDGPARAAEQIRASGGIPGIWVAPFAVQPSSLLFGEHPDWLVKDASGKPLALDYPAEGPDGHLHALDSSIPDVREWLSGVFRELHEAGFAHFMLDLLDFGCVRGKRANPGTRLEAYREGMRAIRRGAGSAYLLGCRVPWTGGARLLDGVTAGSPPAQGEPKKWSVDAFTEAHCNFWGHRLLWNADPEPVVAGEDKEASPEELWANILSAALSGGSLFFRSSPSGFGAGNGGLIAAALRMHRPVAAEPVDLLLEDMPRLLLQRMGGSRFRLGVFNFGDAARVIPVDLALLGVKRAKVRVLDGAKARPAWNCAGRLLTPPVPARGALLLQVEGL